MQESKKISPEKAMKVLKENGMNVSQEEAAQIVEFLYKLAHIGIRAYNKRCED